MSQNRSTEFLRDGLSAIVKWHGGDASGCNPQLLLDRITDLLAAAEAREAFPIPDTLPAVPEAREAGKPTAAEVIAACEKHIADTLEGMPDKIDPRMKYREFQYHDYELDEMRKLLDLCAQWKEANHAK